MIGVGKRGNVHLTRFVERSDVTVGAVCDTDPSARDTAQSAAQADDPRSYADYRELLRQEDIEAVLIATPCYLHAEMSAAALDAGKHVFCEKPLAISADQVKLVLDAARKSNAVFQIGQQSRSSPHMQGVVHEIHESGLIGTPLVIKAQRHSAPRDRARGARAAAASNGGFPAGTTT